MSYTKPKDVRAPKYLLSNLEPIVDRGEWKHSVAILEWKGKMRVAMRWNGGFWENGKIHLGNPQSSDHSTWFILLEEYETAVVTSIISQGISGVGGDDSDIDVDAAMEALEVFLQNIKVAEADSETVTTQKGSWQNPRPLSLVLCRRPLSVRRGLAYRLAVLGHCRSWGGQEARLGEGSSLRSSTAQAWRDPCGLTGAVEDRRCLPSWSGAEGRLCKGRDRPVEGKDTP